MIWLIFEHDMPRTRYQAAVGRFEFPAVIYSRSQPKRSQHGHVNEIVDRRPRRGPVQRPRIRDPLPRYPPTEWRAFRFPPSSQCDNDNVSSHQTVKGSPSEERRFLTSVFFCLPRLGACISLFRLPWRSISQFSHFLPFRSLCWFSSEGFFLN